MRAIEKQNPDREGAAWTAYLGKCIKRHLKRKSRGELISIRRHGEWNEPGYVEDPSVRLRIEEMLLAVGRLSEDEQELLRLRFGLKEKKITLREYASRKDISSEEARLRQKDAIQKLRERLGHPCP